MLRQTCLVVIDLARILQQVQLRNATELDFELSCLWGEFEFVGVESDLFAKYSFLAFGIFVQQRISIAAFGPSMSRR